MSKSPITRIKKKKKQNESEKNNNKQTAYNGFASVNDLYQ